MNLCQQLDHLLNGSAPAGVLKAEKTATFDIEVFVLEKVCLEEIGYMHGLTRERIRQLEVKAMKKMKKIKFKTPNGDTVSLHEMFGTEESKLDLIE